MGEKMELERELFELTLLKDCAITDHGEEYAQLAFQRRDSGEYATVWVQGAWLGWQLANAQPAEQASAGSGWISVADQLPEVDVDGLVDREVKRASDLMHVPEQIAVGDATNPRQHAEDALIAVGYWDAAAPRAPSDTQGAERARLDLSSLPMYHDRTFYKISDVEALAALAQQAPDTARDGALNLAPCAYRVGPAAFGAVKIEECGQIEGPSLWSVRQNGNCLSKSGVWGWEPSPSSRDDEFLARCRFASVQDAYTALKSGGAQ